MGERSQGTGLQSVKMVFVLSLAMLLLLGCTQPPSPEDLSRGDYGAFPTAYQTTIKQYMRYRLKDPESAQYTFVKGPKRAWSKQFGDLRFGHAVCAEINAKNSYGGYVGMKLYYFLLHNDVIVRAFGDAQIEQSFSKDLCTQL